MTDHVTNHIDSILNRPGVQLNHDDWESDEETQFCPMCGYVTRFWYVTVFDRAGDYLESLTSRKCLRCDYEKFDIEGGI